MFPQDQYPHNLPSNCLLRVVELDRSRIFKALKRSKCVLHYLIEAFFMIGVFLEEVV